MSFDNDERKSLEKNQDIYNTVRKLAKCVKIIILEMGTIISEQPPYMVPHQHHLFSMEGYNK